MTTLGQYFDTSSWDPADVLSGGSRMYYYYDQLGALRSDQPDEPSLWDLGRFVDEVEQVRRALGLDGTNSVLLGQSWGGLLAMKSALHHQGYLKGLVVSNMMSSTRMYNVYAEDVLMPAMDQSVLVRIKAFEAEGTTDDPQYEALLMERHYQLHVCRLPLGGQPDSRHCDASRFEHRLGQPAFA